MWASFAFASLESYVQVGCCPCLIARVLYDMLSPWLIHSLWLCVLSFATGRVKVNLIAVLRLLIDGILC